MFNLLALDDYKNLFSDTFFIITLVIFYWIWNVTKDIFIQL